MFFFFLPQKSCIAVWYLWALLKWLIWLVRLQSAVVLVSASSVCRFCQSVQLPLHLTHPLVLCSSNIPSVLLETVGKHRKCWQTFSLDRIAQSEQICCRFKTHKISWFVILVGLVLELAVIFFSLFTDDVPQFIVGKWMHHEQFGGYLDNRAPPVCLLNLQITLFPALSDTSMCPLTSPPSPSIPPSPPSDPHFLFLTMMLWVSLSLFHVLVLLLLRLYRSLARTSAALSLHDLAAAIPRCG